VIGQWLERLEQVACEHLTSEAYLIRIDHGLSRSRRHDRSFASSITEKLGEKF